jgi:predicted enzyme related to lactoylglutathione lyase
MASQKRHGSFVWNEFAGADVEEAKRFYAQTLGWTYDAFSLPDGPYWVAKSGDEIVAGFSGLAAAVLPDQAPYWLGYIEVDDLDGRLAAAQKFGAAVLRPAEDVPNVGRVAVIRDPAGVVIGWMSSLNANETS